MLLTLQGEWRVTEGGELVGALVVDLPAAAAASLTVPDVSAFSGAPFMVEEPGHFPLASDVLRQTQEWAVSAFGAARSGYHTAAEEDPLLPKQRAQRPKRHTVATLAQDQAKLAGARERACSFDATGGGQATPWLRAPPSIPLQVLQVQVHR